MNFRNISSWAIRNPVPPLVLFAALLLAGIVSFMRMDVNDSPDVDFPFVNVSVSQPGAAPTELEVQVTQRVEAAVRGIDGVEEINSSVREGNSNTFVQFAIGTPVDRATNDVRDAISQIRGDLPEGILEPQVVRAEGGSTLAIYAVETSDMTLEQLSWYVDNNVAKRLLGLEGMSSVDRYGGVNREIRVTLNPSALQSQGATAAQINQQLRQINTDSAGGRAELPAPSRRCACSARRPARRAVADADRLARAAHVRLGEVATVTDGNSEQRSISKMGGRQILSFGITRAKGASTSTPTRRRSRAREDRGRVERPRQVRADLHRGRLDHRAVRILHDHAVGRRAARVVVVFLFLRDWRATLISAVAIPLSAIPTFWFLDLMGFTLNFLSLLALSLVAGVLVDDAIVEIENIVRHMRMGKSAYQASIDAADEIGLAVLATTMAIVAVFLPVA
jgi:multidrug efflux pump subunit AcrB